MGALSKAPSGLNIFLLLWVIRPPQLSNKGSDLSLMAGRVIRQRDLKLGD